MWMGILLGSIVLLAVLRFWILKPPVPTSINVLTIADGVSLTPACHIVSRQVATIFPVKVIAQIRYSDLSLETLILDKRLRMFVQDPLAGKPLPGRLIKCGTAAPTNSPVFWKLPWRLRKFGERRGSMKIFDLEVLPGKIAAIDIESA